MINIANLSKLLQSSDPEVVQSIINKIENLSGSDGKTFEEILQQVFSQFDIEKFENGQQNNLKFDRGPEFGSETKQEASKNASVSTLNKPEKQAIKLAQIENKVKLKETLQDGTKENRKDEVLVSEKSNDINSSKESREVNEKGGDLEQFSKKDEIVQKNETKPVVESEKNNLKNNLKEFKESEIVQSLQKLYAQKTYKNIENLQKIPDGSGISEKDTQTSKVTVEDKQIPKTKLTQEKNNNTKDNFEKTTAKEELVVNNLLEHVDSQDMSKIQSQEQSKNKINQKSVNSVNILNSMKDVSYQLPNQKLESLDPKKNSVVNTITRNNIVVNTINSDTLYKEKAANVQNTGKDDIKLDQTNQVNIRLEISQDNKNTNFLTKDKIANTPPSITVVGNIKTNQENQRKPETEKLLVQLVQRDEANSEEVYHERVYLKHENSEMLKNVNLTNNTTTNITVNKIKEKNANDVIFIESFGVSNKQGSTIILINTKQEKLENTIGIKNNPKDFEINISTENIPSEKQMIDLRQLVEKMNYLVKIQQTNQPNLNLVLSDIVSNQKAINETHIELNRYSNPLSNLGSNDISYTKNRDNPSTSSISYIINQLSQIIQSSKKEFDKEDINNEIQSSGSFVSKLSDFVKELRVITDLNIMRNYNNSENKIEKSTKANSEVKEKMTYQKLLNYQENYQNEQVQRNSTDSQNFYQKSYSNNEQVELRKNTSESSKNNLEVKSFQVEYKEKKEFETEKHNLSTEDKPKVSNKFIERLAELTYKGTEQRSEIQSNTQIGRYDLAERLQASRNLEEIYEKIREFATLNKIEELVRMKLVPESLGNLDVEMKKEGKQLALFFVAENEKAKEVIEKNIHILRERLVDLDFDIRKIEVKVREEEKYYEHERNHQHPNQQEQNQNENKKRYTYKEVNEDDDERERNI